MSQTPQFSTNDAAKLNQALTFALPPSKLGRATLGPLRQHVDTTGKTIWLVGQPIRDVPAGTEVLIAGVHSNILKDFELPQDRRVNVTNFSYELQPHSVTIEAYVQGTPKKVFPSMLAGMKIYGHSGDSSPTKPSKVPHKAGTVLQVVNPHDPVVGTLLGKKPSSLVYIVSVDRRSGGPAQDAVRPLSTPLVPGASEAAESPLTVSTAVYQATVLKRVQVDVALYCCTLVPEEFLRHS